MDNKTVNATDTFYNIACESFADAILLDAIPFFVSQRFLGNKITEPEILKLGLFKMLGATAAYFIRKVINNNIPDEWFLKKIISGGIGGIIGYSISEQSQDLKTLTTGFYNHVWYEFTVDNTIFSQDYKNNSLSLASNVFYIECSEGLLAEVIEFLVPTKKNDAYIMGGSIKEACVGGFTIALSYTTIYKIDYLQNNFNYALHEQEQLESKTETFQDEL